MSVIQKLLESLENGWMKMDERGRTFDEALQREGVLFACVSLFPKLLSNLLPAF